MDTVGGSGVCQDTVRHHLFEGGGREGLEGCEELVTERSQLFSPCLAQHVQLHIGGRVCWRIGQQRLD